MSIDEAINRLEAAPCPHDEEAKAYWRCSACLRETLQGMVAEAVRGALLKYGAHTDDCDIPDECSCGFDALCGSEPPR